MKLNSTMRLTVICLAASTVSAAYNGFFGKPTSNVESNDKTRRIEQQLRQSFGGAAGNGNSRSIKNGNARSGPRGAPKSAPQEGDVGEQGRALYYGYYEPVPHYYYEPKMYGPYYDPYEYEDYYYYPKKYPEYHYPKYYKSMKSKSKKGKSMKWGGKMDMGKMSWKKWQSKWQKLPPKIPVPSDDHILDMVFQDDAVFGDILDDEDCELFVAAEAFAFGGYTANVTVTEDGSGGPGTQYIWQPDYMQDRYTSDLIDATFSGYCIMTSITDAFCNFVIVNNVQDQITLAGTLTTPTSSTASAGTLAITGGTGAMAGVVGEAEVYANPIGRNVFQLATRFDVDVILGVIVCKPQALPIY